MSDSPKYSDYSVSAEVTQRLREESRRRAEEAAARRAAEEARRREERLRKRQAALKGRAAQVHSELTAFNATSASRHVADSLRELQTRLARVEPQTSGNDGELMRAEQELDRVRRALKQTMAQGSAAQDAQDLEQEAATVLRWKYQAAEDRQGSRQFDPDGLAQFEVALSKVEAQIARRDLAGARKAMSAVGQQFEQHQAKVEERRNALLIRKQAGEVALTRVKERIAAVQADPVAQRWEALTVAEISARTDQLDRLIEQGQFEHATTEAEKLLAEGERVLKAAEERQALQEHQDYIAESTIKAFQDCGFIFDGTNQSAQGAATDILQFHRLDGREIAVSVQNGAMTWDPKGFPMQVVAGSSGQPATVCDEAVEQIDEVRERLKTDYGVETCDLSWAGQNPNRPRKTAKRLRRPTSHTSRRTRGAQE